MNVYIFIKESQILLEYDGNKTICILILETQFRAQT